MEPGRQSYSGPCIIILLREDIRFTGYRNYFSWGVRPTTADLAGITPCPKKNLRYDTIDDLHWKTDRQAASLI